MEILPIIPSPMPFMGFPPRFIQVIPQLSLHCEYRRPTPLYLSCQTQAVYHTIPVVEETSTLGGTINSGLE